MSEPEEDPELPTKRAPEEEEPKTEIQKPQKFKKLENSRAPADKEVDEEHESSFEPSEESEDTFLNFYSDEGAHGDDSDFDIQDYLRFKETEGQQEEQEVRPAKKKAPAEEESKGEEAED